MQMKEKRQDAATAAADNEVDIEELDEERVIEEKKS